MNPIENNDTEDNDSIFSKGDSVNVSRHMELAQVFLGGQWVRVRGHGALWSVTETAEPHHIRVRVGDKYHRLLTVHDGFDLATGFSRSTYVLGEDITPIMKGKKQ